jgi:CheY-like chemotaxis protein
MVQGQPMIAALQHQGVYLQHMAYWKFGGTILPRCREVDDFAFSNGIEPMSFSLRVVIGDDSPEMRESVRQMLGNLGHDVVAVADNGEMLIQQCAQLQPDVVITGTLTPEMHGCDAAAVIYSTRPIPIILYSGHCEPDLVLNAEHKHVFLYLVKPICEEHLQAALKECQRMDSNESSEGDENKVAVGPSSGHFGTAPYREHSRPPYRKLPR